MINSVGRFAPSPSGLLHFGSLVTALGSYLQTKSAHGLWLVRIEDLDKPREAYGASAHILASLEKLGLYWDREVVYQSKRQAIYQEILHSLTRDKLAYYCDCSRKRIQSLTSHVYDNHCRYRHLKSSHERAVRLRQIHCIERFIDNIQQTHIVSPQERQEDFIIRRKDGLFAYNFAVVIDDHLQGVTEVVRGADLLPVTVKQIFLHQLLDWRVPAYYHLPLALNEQHNKLSKQNHAPAINLNDIERLLIEGLRFLGQPIPCDWQDATKEQILHWAIEHWNVRNVPKKNMTINSLPTNNG